MPTLARVLSPVLVKWNPDNAEEVPEALSFSLISNDLILLV